MEAAAIIPLPPCRSEAVRRRNRQAPLSRGSLAAALVALLLTWLVSPHARRILSTVARAGCSMAQVRLGHLGRWATRKAASR
ncbi:hypothetical protein RLIN73S_03947 [Rhodanobacter lindaniclasticus]